MPIDIRLKKASLLILILGIYFAVRLPFLWQIPLFEDEALFTGWSLEMKENFGNFLKPVSAGISPLFSWLTFFLLPITANQFAAGRLLSLLAGSILVLLVYYSLHYVFQGKYPFFLTLIYIFLPIMFVYNRLALLDTLMVLFIFGTIFASFLFIKQPSLNLLIIFVCLTTLALLTKPLAALAIPAILLSRIFLTKKVTGNTLLLLGGAGLSLGIFFLIFFPSRTQTGFILSNFIFFPHDNQEAILLFKKNAWLTLHWIYAYYPLPVLTAAFFGLIITFIGRNQTGRYYTGVFGILSLSLIATARIYFPRHTLIFAPLVVLLCAIFILYVKKFSRKLAFFFTLILLGYSINSTVSLIIKPEQNKVMAKEDTFQFYEDWTSGKRLSQIARYLDAQVVLFGEITVWTDTTKLYFYGLPLYLQEKNKITIKEIPVTKERMSFLVEKNPAVQFLIINKSLPYPVRFVAGAEFPVSGRHAVKIVRLN